MAASGNCPQKINGACPLPLLHPILLPASWNAGGVVATLATILDHESKGLNEE